MKKKTNVPHILNSYVIVSVLQPLYSASLQAIYLTTYLTCIPPFCFTSYLTFYIAFYAGILSGIFSGPGAPYCILSSRYGSSPGAPANSTCDLEIGPSPPHHLALAICRSGPGAPMAFCTWARDMALNKWNPSSQKQQEKDTSSKAEKANRGR